MNKVILLFSFWCVNLAFGQHNLPIQMDTSHIQGEITAYGIIDYSGTSMQNAMSSKLIYGGFIDNATKTASFDNHNQKNIYGLEVSGEIDYRNYTAFNSFLKGKYGFYVRGGVGAYAAASYTKDLFGLTFFGNQSYTGDTANFSGTELNGVVFQKIGFGLIDKKMKSNFGINFYNLSGFGEAFIRDGQLASDSSGSNLDLTLDGRFQYANGAQFNKGWGIGTDLDFRFQTQWIKDRTAFFQVKLKNLGLMHINTVEEYSIDTNYNFSGFKYEQLFGDDAISIGDREELMDSLGITKTEQSITTLLPGFVQIGKIVDNNTTQKLQSFFGVRLYTTLAYNPMVYGGAQYQVYPWMKIGLQASYGGFSKFRVGFYTQYNFKKVYLGIGSENLIGALSKKGKGESIHVRLALRW